MSKTSHHVQGINLNIVIQLNTLRENLKIRSEYKITTFHLKMYFIIVFHNMRLLFFSLEFD